MKLICRLLPVFLGIAMGSHSGFSQQISGPGLPEVRIGVVIDGPWERNEEILELSRQEILALTQRSYRVTFPPEKTLTAEWSMDSATRAVRQLMEDPEVDVVITWGLIASDVASRLPNYSKPVIAPVCLNPHAQGLPLVSDERGSRISGVHNLSYVTWNSQLAEDLETLYEIRPYRKLLILVNPFGVAQNPMLVLNITDTAASLSFRPEVVPIPVGFSVEEVLAQIPPDAEAAYVAPLLHLSGEQWQSLVDGLHERKLVTFSLLGRREVERGILGTLAPDTDFNRLTRRVALNLKRILDGEDAGSLNIDFERGSRLTINMRTARAIGVYPKWSLLTEADLIEEQRTDSVRLSLKEVTDEAVRANLELRVADRSVAAGLERIRQARSALSPQLGLSAAGFFIDKDRAEGSFGSQGRSNFVGTASVRQLVFSDPVRANLEIAREVQLSREREREELRLDIVVAAASAYLHVLRAKAFEDIQKQNLARTRQNLEIAQNRVRTGVASRAELLRWENEISVNRRDVIRANSDRNRAEIEVNRLRNRPLEEPFGTVETGLEDPLLFSSFNQISNYVGDPWSFRVFREFMVEEGLRISPELEQLDAGIRAQTRALVTAQRAFWAPTVAFQGDVSGRARAGGELDGLFELPGLAGFPRAGNVDWTLALNVEFPLHTGGRRDAEKAEAVQELERLQLQREALAELIEQRIRSELHATGASFASIDLAKNSLQAARQNLDLVRDAYRQGLVSIIDLIDAQNSTLVSEQVAANAVFDYLIDLMNVQRAVGRFDFFTTANEHSQWLRRLDEFFSRRRP